jgi:hypothetical protein
MLFLGGPLSKNRRSIALEMNAASLLHEIRYGFAFIIKIFLACSNLILMMSLSQPESGFWLR